MASAQRAKSAPKQPSTAPAKKAAPAKRPAPARRGAQGAPPDGLVDKALKARWEEAIARYRKARTEEIEGWDERYEALGDILDSDPPYYLAGGYKNARAFLQVEVPDQDERSVRTYIRVARFFEPDDQAKHGISKLDLLLRYLEAAGGVPLAPAKIRPDKQKIRVARGKTERLAPFPEVTFDELRQATRAAARSAGKVTKTATPMVRALSALLTKAKLRGVGVRLRGGKVDLSGIPAADLTALGKALASAKLPEAKG